MFALHVRLEKLIHPTREYRFNADRKWRFDFAWPDIRIAVEVEGGTSFGLSRHSRGEGFEADCEKYNAAAAKGWRVFRFTTQMVKDGRAIAEIKRHIPVKLIEDLGPGFGELK